jgi:hypothetical protein
VAGDNPKAPGDEGARPARSREAKRAYLKPRILAREQLEALASDCRTVVKNNFGDCPGKPLKS